MSSPKRIVISHVYSRNNKGDAALTSVLIRELRRKYPQARLAIVALQPDKKTFEGVREYPSFMSYILTNSLHPVSKLLRLCYMVPLTLVWAAWFRLTKIKLWLPAPLEKTAELYAKADLIVPVGGGHIRSQKGFLGLVNVPLLLHPLWLGNILKKPTILHSQSIGPFRNRFEKWLVRLTLKRMTLILLRENTSMELLKNLGITSNVERAVDAGFLHTTTKKIRLHNAYGISPKKLLIGVTVRAWLQPEGQTAYEKAVAKTLDTVIETSSAQVIFIPQVTASKGDDDRTVSQRVFSHMKHQNQAIVVHDQPDHHEIKALYQELDLLLGTRFHSVIFSLTSYVPVVAIEYEHKTSGIMHDLNLDEWVLMIEAISERELTAKMKQLIAQRAAYKKHLKHQLPAYIAEARQAIEQLGKAYDNALSSGRYDVVKTDS